MGSAKPATTYSPGEAAQAATGAAGAGEIMSIADQPIEQYSQLATTEALGPAQIQAQQSIANRAAKSGAQAQMDIQSSVDPQAYAQRQLRMNAANQTLGAGSTGWTRMPRLTTRRAIPTRFPAPPICPIRRRLARNARAIASNLVGRGGQ